MTELLLFGALGDAVEKMGHAMLVRVIADQMMSAQMVFSVVVETAKKIFLMTILGGAGVTIDEPSFELLGLRLFYALGNDNHAFLEGLLVDVDTVVV